MIARAVPYLALVWWLAYRDKMDWKTVALPLVLLALGWGWDYLKRERDWKRSEATRQRDKEDRAEERRLERAEREKEEADRREREKRETTTRGVVCTRQTQCRPPHQAPARVPAWFVDTDGACGRCQIGSRDADFMYGLPREGETQEEYKDRVARREKIDEDSLSAIMQDRGARQEPSERLVPDRVRIAATPVTLGTLAVSSPTPESDGEEEMEEQAKGKGPFGG